jgi:hypothetical protein
MLLVSYTYVTKYRDNIAIQYYRLHLSALLGDNIPNRTRYEALQLQSGTPQNSTHDPIIVVSNWDAALIL